MPRVMVQLMEAAAEKPTVVVRPSFRAAVDPRARQAAEELLAELSADGHDVRLEIPDPGQFSAQNSLDAIDIVVTTGASTLVALVITDVYKGVKRWMGKRMAEDKAAGPMYITFRGPDGKPRRNLLGRAGEVKDMTPEDRGD